MSPLSSLLLILLLLAPSLRLRLSPAADTNTWFLTSSLSFRNLNYLLIGAFPLPVVGEKKNYFGSFPKPEASWSNILSCTVGVKSASP